CGRLRKVCESGAARRRDRVVSGEHPRSEVKSGAGAGSVPFPAFQFRDRHEGPDWRRLSAVDVCRVSREGNVAALQEHLEHVTFCSAEQERCPHCQGPADPLLLKLLRLAQLCTEYLLHSQEYLSAQLGSLEEALRASLAERDQLSKEMTQRSQEIKALKEECRRRKKMISTQQMMLEARASYHQSVGLTISGSPSATSLIRAPGRQHTSLEPGSGQQMAKTDKLQDEIDKLKEQLQLTKSHNVNFSKALVLWTVFIHFVTGTEQNVSTTFCLAGMCLGIRT
uniref:DAZ interacting zinc finger protein 1 n=1 Tax=Amazona collaria TaxID=241587 RepID=A0A8B9FP70_9PSIT